MVSCFRQCTLAVCLLAILGGPPDAKSNTFGTAMNFAYASSQEGSIAVYWGMQALYYSGQGFDTSAQTYYSYIYLDSAARSSWQAYQAAYSAYLANASTTNYYAQLYAYYDWYYKYFSAYYLSLIYLYGSQSAVSSVITSTYSALFYENLAAYWLGLASQGGTR